MKPLTSKVTKALTTGSRLVCADNSGAKIYEIIGVRKYHGVRGRYPKAGVGDVVICSVKKGTPKKRKTICLLYTSPSPRDLSTSRMPSSA